MSEYTVDRITGGTRVDPDAGGEGDRRHREKAPRKAPAGDSVTISEEAMRRSGEQRERGAE